MSFEFTDGAGANRCDLFNASIEDIRDLLTAWEDADSGIRALMTQRASAAQVRVAANWNSDNSIGEMQRNSAPSEEDCFQQL